MQRSRPTPTIPAPDAACGRPAPRPTGDAVCAPPVAFTTGGFAPGDPLLQALDTAHRARRGAGAAAAHGRPAAAVVDARGGRARAAEQIARLRKRVRGVPCVLLEAAAATDHAREGPAGLDAQGAVADFGCHEDVAARLLEALDRAAREVELGLVGSSCTMQEVRGELAAAAASPSTVLLEGETGTGKGVAARALHALSARARHPFEVVDCSALTPGLVESELFGHRRGAFTGALGDSIGAFGRAGAGTLFLDEVGELDARSQARLLHALEERDYLPVGGAARRPLAARVVAATNRDLERDLDSGRFRRDLYYRLHVVAIRLPALRERPDDIAALVEHFAVRVAGRLGRPPPHIAASFVDALGREAWPGNVRELAHRLESLLVRAPLAAELRGSATPPRARASAGPTRQALGRAPGGATCEADERQRLTRLLRECGGNVARAARRLGLARSTLRYRIRRAGLEGLLPRD